MAARLLVVEDNALNRRLFEVVLTAAGHVVESAVDVPQARAKLHPGIDLVVLDIQIPGGGGEYLLREIRRTPSLRDLPVVAVTALAMAGDKERLLAAGFDGYLSKPIDVRRFAPTIETYLRSNVVIEDRCERRRDFSSRR